MITVSYEQFRRLVAQRNKQWHRSPAQSRRQERVRERVLRPDQERCTEAAPPRRLATCPRCDFVVDAQHLHALSGLCPRCHEEQTGRV
jgi:hypothetical protein